MDEVTLKKKKLAFKVAGSRAVKASYLKYVELTHTTVNEETDWKRGKHLIYVCNKVQEFIEADTGNAYDIMILNLPPQTGKSTSVTESLPSWYLGKNPDKSAIVLAYGDDLAQRFGRRNKEKIERFGNLFFDIKLSRTKTANDDFEIAGSKGRMITRGIMAGITGNPAHLLIIDDPIRTRDEAYSPVIREKIWQEWLSSVKTRLASGAKVIVVMTRWHEADLAGQLLATEKNVTHINITCEAEENDILGREIGDGPFPEIGKGRKWKDEIKASYVASEGLEAWMAMFQGNPILQGGNIFKKDWFNYFDEPPATYQKIISVDAAFKETKTSDFVAIGVWSKSGANVYLEEVINERMDFVKTIEVIRNLKARHKDANMVLIEDKANGSAIISTLQREIMGVVAVEPLGSKESRAQSIQPFVMAGNVHLPREAPWLIAYIDQMTRFPKGKHDDMVDMTSQALFRLKDYIADAPEAPKAKGAFKFLEKSKTVYKDLVGGKVDRSFVNY